MLKAEKKETPKSGASPDMMDLYKNNNFVSNSLSTTRERSVRFADDGQMSKKVVESQADRHIKPKLNLPDLHIRCTVSAKNDLYKLSNQLAEYETEDQMDPNYKSVEGIEVFKKNQNRNEINKFAQIRFGEIEDTPIYASVEATLRIHDELMEDPSKEMPTANVLQSKHKKHKRTSHSNKHKSIKASDEDCYETAATSLSPARRAIIEPIKKHRSERKSKRAPQEQVEQQQMQQEKVPQKQPTEREPQKMQQAEEPEQMQQAKEPEQMQQAKVPQKQLKNVKPQQKQQAKEPQEKHQAKKLEEQLEPQQLEPQEMQEANEPQEERNKKEPPKSKNLKQKQVAKLENDRIRKYELLERMFWNVIYRKDELYDWNLLVPLFLLLVIIAFLYYNLTYDLRVYINEERRFLEKMHSSGIVMKCIFYIMRLLKVPIF